MDRSSGPTLRPQEAPVTAPRRPIRIALALLLGAAALAVPAHAGTQSELDQARERLESAQAELDRVNARWQETEARLARAQDAAALARSEIDRLEEELERIRQSLNDRVAATFMSGGSLSIGSLLTADSIEDAADRFQYAQSVVQGDVDLATEVAVKAEELRRQEARLRRAARAEAAAAADLEARRADIGRTIERLDDLVAELKAELNAQDQRVLSIGGPIRTLGSGPIRTLGSGAIQTCPVAGPNSFVDSFGWPRPGGRTHEGIDLIAGAGTPVVAVAPGNARPASSVLGGLGVVVEHDSGDWTFYAHLSSYGASGRVSAGTVIGSVGATGSTTVNHLHFEHHPNGGAAVNPYAALVAVC